MLKSATHLWVTAGMERHWPFWTAGDQTPRSNQHTPSSRSDHLTFLRKTPARSKRGNRSQWTLSQSLQHRCYWVVCGVCRTGMGVNDDASGLYESMAKSSALSAFRSWILISGRFPFSTVERDCCHLITPDATKHQNVSECTVDLDRKYWGGTMILDY